MKYVLTPETFSVQELFNPILGENGRYYYYILEKKGISHKEAAKKLSNGGMSVYFAGIKDKNASTKQWFCTNEKIDEFDEPNFKTKFRGCSNERIHVGKHKGNVFTIIVELSEEEQTSLKHFKAKNEFVCNYFGEQRFSENTLHIINALKEENYELALKLFLTKESKFDSPKSTKIKEVISTNWRNWKKILESEEIKGTGKVELFTFLETNPTDFREAFSHAEEKSLKTILKAAQAIRFNEELNKIAQLKKPNNLIAQIAGQKLNVSSSKAFPRKIIIQPTQFEEKFRKSYLERKTFFTAEKFRTRRIDKNKFELGFSLQKGSYATIFLAFLDSWLKNKVNKGKSSN